MMGAAAVTAKSQSLALVFRELLRTTKQKFHIKPERHKRLPDNGFLFKKIFL